MLLDLLAPDLRRPVASGRSEEDSGTRRGAVADILRLRLGDDARKVPRYSFPDFVVRALALVVPPLRDIVPLLSRTTQFSNAKARTVLGFAPRPVEETIVDCARSLLDRGR